MSMVVLIRSEGGKVRWLRPVRCLIMACLFVPVLAGPSSAYTCSFIGAAAPLNFGALDPAVANDVSVTTTVSIRCTGAGTPPLALSLDDDDGLYETGPNLNQMLNTLYAGEYLPYSISYTAAGSVSRGQRLDIVITGTVMGIVYQDASIGTYTDTIVFTVAP